MFVLKLSVDVFNERIFKTLTFKYKIFFLYRMFYKNNE